VWVARRKQICNLPAVRRYCHFSVDNVTVIEWADRICNEMIPRAGIVVTIIGVMIYVFCVLKYCFYKYSGKRGRRNCLFRAMAEVITHCSVVFNWPICVYFSKITRFVHFN
jgi:hypothetical protein